MRSQKELLDLTNVFFKSHITEVNKYQSNPEDVIYFQVGL